jgi:hypothetical protein
MAAFKDVNSLLRTLVLAGVVVIAGYWSWFIHGKLSARDAELEEQRERIEGLANDVQEREQRIVELGDDLSASEARVAEQDEELARQRRQIRDLEAAVQLLKIDHRLARLEVLEQRETPDGVRSRVRFTELDEDGEPLGPGQELEVDGSRVYVEALVIKFDDSYVEHGDFLRGTSVCMFRSLFGDAQKPSEGALLDSPMTQPPPYGGGDDLDDFHAELWHRFWEYANDPEAAAKKGVRAIHGEAPFMEVRPGKSYRVELRASGGLTIGAE